MRRFWAWLFLVVSAAVAQQAASDDVIRIDVNLVQVDAVVTDSKHHWVTNLKASDFQVLQDGEPQHITNFSFVNLRPPVTPTAAPAVKGAPLPPPPMLRPEQARRLIALVVDDLGLSFEGAGYVRNALKKFVTEQMQPDDLVAIIRTGAGMGALQQFTADKRILDAAISHVRFNSMGRVGVSAFTPLGSEDTTALNAEREGIVAAGSLGAIRYVVDGLRDLPGRKSVVLFSESLRLFSNDTENTRVMNAVRQLEDAANRAAVVIYSIDPRGLQTLSLEAADDTSRKSASAVLNITRLREQQMAESQEGMALLANGTGGRFFHDTNDIAGALRDAVADTEGYYLLGYHPDASTFDAKTGQPKFHNVKVKVLRAGLEVRSRGGFFGRPDAQRATKPQTPRQKIAAALTSPFGENDVHVRLTTLFAESPANKPFVDAMLYIDARDLKFADQPGGWHKAAFEVSAVTFDENGAALDSSSKAYTVQLKDDALEAALQGGLIYNMQHPVKKPGAYQMRVALMDGDSGKVGSANEFIEVPDISKGKLTLSSLVLRQYLKNPAAGAAASEGVINEGRVTGDPAVRVFQPGEDILYGYQILNARATAGHPPEVEASTRVFRDGQEIHAGSPMPLSLKDQPDGRRLGGGGLLRLGPQMHPGDYVLQIVVTDKAAKTSATQWTDFQVRAPNAPAPQ